MMGKPRLFVDMDGTLAEFRKIHIDVNINEVEGIYTTRKKLDGILRKPGYFARLSPQENVVNAVKKIISEKEIEVYILSCYLPGCTAKEDKNKWLDVYLPVIDKEHRIFVPDGKDKKGYVPGGISSEDYLLDDYSHNLDCWCISGKGIKLWNGINGNKGSWTGNALRFDKPAEILAKEIASIILDKKFLRDLKPQKSQAIDLDFLMEEWWNYRTHTNPTQEKLIYTKIRPITPSFSNYDDWKLANNSDYRKEEVVEKKLKKEDVFDYIREEIPEYNFDEEGLPEKALYPEFDSLFQSWKEKEIRHLEESLETAEEYELWT